MNCYYHPGQVAIGVCKHCGRGICSDCTTLMDDILSCKDRHEAEVHAAAVSQKLGYLQAQRLRIGYVRNATFYTLVGALFLAFGLFQYRFLGIQAVFFALIGLFLLYAGAANFLESRKF